MPKPAPLSAGDSPASAPGTSADMQHALSWAYAARAENDSSLQAAHPPITQQCEQ
jgi:hypothetical protein